MFPDTEVVILTAVSDSMSTHQDISAFRMLRHQWHQKNLNTDWLSWHSRPERSHTYRQTHTDSLVLQRENNNIRSNMNQSLDYKQIYKLNAMVNGLHQCSVFYFPHNLTCFTTQVGIHPVTYTFIHRLKMLGSNHLLLSKCKDNQLLTQDPQTARCANGVKCPIHFLSPMWTESCLPSRHLRSTIPPPRLEVL